MRRGVIIILSLFAAAATAQTYSSGSGRAVDQTVEDMGPNAASLRRIDPGNAQFPTRSMITELTRHASWSQLGVPDSHRYEYRAPGVTARLNRPDYLVLGPDGRPGMNAQPVIDGAFQELAPADMVYSLMPEAPTTVDPAARYPDWQDTRVDGRLNNRLTHTPVDTLRDGTLPAGYIDPGTSAAPRTAAGYANDSSLQQVPVNIPRRRAVRAEPEASEQPEPKASTPEQ